MIFPSNLPEALAPSLGPQARPCATLGLAVDDAVILSTPLLGLVGRPQQGDGPRAGRSVERAPVIREKNEIYIVTVRIHLCPSYKKRYRCSVSVEPQI